MNNTKKLIETFKNLPNTEVDSYNEQLLILTDINKKKKVDFLIINKDFMKISLREELFDEIVDFLKPIMSNKDIDVLFLKYGETVEFSPRYNIILQKDSLTFTEINSLTDKEIYRIVYEELIKFNSKKES